MTAPLVAQPCVDAPYATSSRSSRASPGCSRTIRRLHLFRHADLSGRRRRGGGDRPGPGPSRACRGAPRGDRRPDGGRAICLHPHPSRPSPGGRGARRRRPARRSSAARRWRWRASGRAPTPPSTSTMRPTGCWPTARRSRSTAEAADGGGDAGPHLQPSLLRAMARRCSPAIM